MNVLNHKKLLALTLFAMLLSSCTGGRSVVSGYSHTLSNVGGNYKVGKPYKIMGQSYTPTEDYNYVETGISSWYGEDFHAKYTANGETYDMNTLTAAHRTLPLPSIVRVTNLENGRSLVLRVNDRGPFVKNRIIDVSKRAAGLLGYQAQGVAKVKVEILAEESKALKAAMTGEKAPIVYAKQTPKTITIPKKVVSNYNAASTTATGSIFYIQAGSFANKEVANNLKNQLHKYGEINIMPAEINGNKYYRVRVGPFYGKVDANIALLKIKDAGLSDARVIIE